MAGVASGVLSSTYNLCRLGDLTLEMSQLRTAGTAMLFSQTKVRKRGVLFPLPSSVP